MEDENYLLNMWDSHIERDTEEDRVAVKLIQWFSTIPIMKHVRINEIGRVFGDGVLLIHLLRELGIQEVQDIRDECLLPADTFKGKLSNWKIINEQLLQKLNLGVTEWYLEFIAHEKKGYAEAVLDSIHKLVEKREKKKTRPLKRGGGSMTTPSYNRFRRLEQERVIWGTGRRRIIKRQRNRRRSRKVPEVTRYFKSGGARSRGRESDHDDDSVSVLGETKIQTYCFLAKKRNLDNPFSGAFNRINNQRNSRFSYRHGYSKYIYKYYEQFPYNCAFCNSVEACKCTDV